MKKEGKLFAEEQGEAINNDKRFIFDDELILNDSEAALFFE